MFKFATFFGILLLLITSCAKEQNISITENSTSSQFEHVSNYEEHNPYFCNSPSEAEAGQIYRHEGKTWLWGGHEEGEDFNISNWSLQVQNLGSGLGRKLIKALAFPVYEKKSKLKIQDDEKVIVVKGEEEVRVYTYDLLTKHELVNDIIDGQPILVGYCPLADLAVVYNRTFCEVELFFALSGYTYIEQDEKRHNTSQEEIEAIESFILWDRNTESLWYPYRNVAVSGKMHNQKMKYYDKDKWELTTFDEAIEKYGNMATVLSYSQSNVDENWEYLNSEAIYCN